MNPSKDKWHSHFLNMKPLWLKSTTENVRLTYTEITYLLKFLDLWLLKHGEDVGASFLSSPLSLIWGLFARLGKTAQNWISFESQHSNHSDVSNSTQGIQYPHNTWFSFFLSFPNRGNGSNKLTYHVWLMDAGLRAEVWCQGGVLCPASLISCAPIIGLRWAPQFLIWLWSCSYDKRWGRPDSKEVENWRQEGKWGSETDLCCQTVWSILHVWWLQFQSLISLNDSEHIQNDKKFVHLFISLIIHSFWYHRIWCTFFLKWFWTHLKWLKVYPLIYLIICLFKRRQSSWFRACLALRKPTKWNKGNSWLYFQVLCTVTKLFTAVTCYKGTTYRATCTHIRSQTHNINTKKILHRKAMI